MSISKVSESRREAYITPAILVYSVACFFILPREWVFPGLAPFVLFGFCFYFRTSVARIGSAVLLIATIIVSHSLAPPPPPLSQNIYFVFLAGTKLYVLEFLTSIGLMIGLMVLDHGAAGDIKANSNAIWIWVVGGILLYFVFPFPYRLTYAASCPLLFSAYAGKGYYRAGSLLLMVFLTFLVGTQLRATHAYIWLGVAFWGAVAAAWFIRRTEKSLK
jgi:hypothetical protein